MTVVEPVVQLLGLRRRRWRSHRDLSRRSPFVAPFLPGLIAFGSSAGVGAVIAVILGRVDRADVLRSAHVCLFLTQLIYRLAQVGPAKEIEAATSLPQR